MSNYLIRLNSIKAHIEKREFRLAVKEIEDLLYLLKVDYLSNVDPIRSKEAFNKLYGYTSDKSGIRHNGGVDENTTFEEAQYMLVSCSAFLNYLICIYEK